MGHIGGAKPAKRQTLFDYHQRQLINLTSSIAAAGRGANGNLQHQHQNAAPRAQHQGALRDALARAGHEGEGAAAGAEGEPQGAPQMLAGPASGSATPASDQFLNSRLAELHQRYVYLKDSHRRLSTDVDRNEELILSGPSMANELEANYGQVPGFGWLVVGNIGRMVGVTLTSVAAPSKRQQHPKSRAGEEDLMVFHDDMEFDGANNGQQQQCNSHSHNNERTHCKIPKQINDQTSRPDKSSMRSNYNLRGHLDEVILVKWNELYQKLATIDSKGNVLIWCKVNEKFTIQTPFYNRTKSVADFKWSNDGKTALICYTDSFILVGSSSGQRHWHSMLNLDDYHITCASWTPNDEQLLLGVSNGNVVVIDLPHSELTELVVNQTNIRTMCWSSCDMSLRNLSKLSSSASSSFLNRRNSTVVNHRRLSRDCSVFSRYRFCSQGPTSGGSRAPSSANPAAAAAAGPTSGSNSVARLRSGSSPSSAVSGQQGTIGGGVGGTVRLQQEQEQHKERNVLAIDFANNTIKLYDGGLDDPEPRTVQVGQESYIMHWSSDGKVLAVAGFNIHTSAPSIGCLRCRYLNSIKFYDQQGQLIHEHTLKYTRYPITAFTWAHNDRRIFLATGPRLHCAKVFFGIAPLSLLAVSCLQRFTKLPDKSDIMEGILRRHRLGADVLAWQSHNCPIDIAMESVSFGAASKGHQSDQLSGGGVSGNSCPSSPTSSTSANQVCHNTNVYQFQLPSKLQAKIDELFGQTIRQPCDERWSLNDIIWHVPKEEQRHYCTLVCYASEHEISTTGYQHKTDFLTDRMGDNGQPHASDQYKIFVLYIEFQGSLVPILRARRVGFLKPEFVIFDPEDNNQLRTQRLRKVSDVSVQSSSSFLNDYIQSRYGGGGGAGSGVAADAGSSSVASASSHQMAAAGPSMAPFYCNEGFAENCSDLHLHSEPRASAASSDAEHYYNFECEKVNQTRLADLVSGRSHHQEPIVLPMSSNPYLLYMMSMSAAGHSHSLSHQQQQTASKYMCTGPTLGMLPQIPASSMTTKAIAAATRRANNSTSARRYKLRSSGLTSSLTERNELVRIRSNIWGTKFKLINVGNRMIKQRSILGSVLYKASILHLQPRQIFLNIKDMSNYCCLCSKHHHSGRQPGGSSSNGHRQQAAIDCSGGRNQQQHHQSMSLIDMPNIEPPLISPLRSERRSRSGRRPPSAGDKVLMPVGDVLRVAPKLESNQHYKPVVGGLLVDNQRPSTSKEARQTSGTKKQHWERAQSSERAGGASNSNRSKSNQKRAQSSTYQQQQQQQHPSLSEIHSRRIANNDHEHNNDQDDILTLSLGQGDQVKVEMSSVRSLHDEDTSHRQNLSGGSNNKATVETMDEFLATNKTLKSIQTITKMIVDLSSKAHELDNDGNKGEEDVEEFSSPSKLVKLSDATKAISPGFKHAPPETPVHRPRRIASRPPSEAQFQTQSATTTPLSRRPRRKRAGRANAAEKGTPPTRNLVPPPAPPPAIPMRQRLSSSAKRFIDGSLRSIYGSYSTSDAEPEESEPLVTAPHVPWGRGLPLDMRRRFLGAASSSSQPCSPMRGLNSSTTKRQAGPQASSSTSFRDQLANKLRGATKTTTTTSNQKLKKRPCSVSSSQLNDFDARSDQRNSRRHPPSSKAAPATDASFSDSSSGGGSSDSSLSDSCDDENENDNEDRRNRDAYEIPGFNPWRAASQAFKFGYSSSARDLTRAQDDDTRASARLDGGDVRRAGPRANNKSTKTTTKSAATRRRRRDRRRSICPNSNCCCSKEFKLNNRPPVWNEISQVYQLDFGGRVTQESAKNLQIDFEGNLALQFGRIDRCTYTLDYKYPFNAVQAMAIALASLTQRLK